MTRFKTVLLTAVGALGLSACAGNYAAEGALGGAAIGAATGVLTGGDVARSAKIGAAVGGVSGALIRREGRCFRIDDDGFERRVRCP